MLPSRVQQAFEDQALDAGARDGADALSQEFVEPAAGVLGRGDGSRDAGSGDAGSATGRICGG